MPPISTARRALISLGLSLLALATGVAVFAALAALRQPLPQRAPSRRIFNVQVFEVQPYDLQEVVSGFGTARSMREVVVAAEVGGRITAIDPKLKVGRRVEGPKVTVDASGQSHRRTGDLLIQIDPCTYEERLSQALSLIAQDKAELEALDQEEKNVRRLLQQALVERDEYRKECERVAQLVERGALRASDLTRARLELLRYEDAVVQYENQLNLVPLRRRTLQERLEAHQADKRLAELDLQRTQVRPPFSGRVDRVFVEVGSIVRPGDPLFRLIDASRVEVPVPLPLSEYTRIGDRLERGEPVLAELAENETAEARWIGEVTRAGASIDQVTRTIEVFVEVDNSKQSGPLLPGAFVHARIDGPIWRDALAIPRDAVVAGRVFVAESVGEGQAELATARSRRIRVRRTLQNLAILDPERSDLRPGDQVILTNLDVLTDDTLVRVQSRRQLQDELERQRVRAAKLVAARARLSREMVGRAPQPQ